MLGGTAPTHFRSMPDGWLLSAGTFRNLFPVSGGLRWWAFSQGKPSQLSLLFELRAGILAELKPGILAGRESVAFIWLPVKPENKVKIKSEEEGERREEGGERETGAEERGERKYLVLRILLECLQ